MEIGRAEKKTVFNSPSPPGTTARSPCLRSSLFSRFSQSTARPVGAGCLGDSSGQQGCSFISGKRVVSAATSSLHPAQASAMANFKSLFSTRPAFPKLTFEAEATDGSLDHLLSEAFAVIERRFALIVGWPSVCTCTPAPALFRTSLPSNMP